MTPEELDLDTVRNKVLYPVFQATLKTPETAAVVLDMAKDVEKSRKIWEAAQEYFRASVYHQNTKSSLKTVPTAQSLSLPCLFRIREGQCATRCTVREGGLIEQLLCLGSQS